MAARVQQKRGGTTAAPAVEDDSAPASTEKGNKLKADIEDLLDDIDGVLEKNSEEFVRSYVQKGGE